MRHSRCTRFLRKTSTTRSKLLNKAFCFNRLCVGWILQFWCIQRNCSIDKVWGKISSRVHFSAGKMNTENGSLCVAKIHCFEFLSPCRSSWDILLTAPNFSQAAGMARGKMPMNRGSIFSPPMRTISWAIPSAANPGDLPMPAHWIRL